MHRLDHRRRESAWLVASSVTLGITLVPLTSVVARIVSVVIGVRVLGSSSLDFFALGIALVPLTSHVVCIVDHRRRESAWLVIFGPLRLRHSFGVSYLARRVHRLDHRRRESGRLVVDSVALGIALVPLTSAVAYFVSITVCAKAASSSSAPLPSVSLAPLTWVVVCFISITVGVRVLGSSSLDFSPSALPWCRLPCPSRASSWSLSA